MSILMQLLKNLVELKLDKHFKIVADQSIKSLASYKIKFLLKRKYILYCSAIPFFSNKVVKSVMDTTVDTILNDCDFLYNKSKLDELLLKLDSIELKNDKTDAEIYWRQCRAIIEKNKKEKGKDFQVNIRNAHKLAIKALEINPEISQTHKWYAISLNLVSEFDGRKIRIQASTKIKHHFTEALKYNPNDSTLYYALGYWCYVFASLTFIERTAASVVFATPPTATYEQALGYFEKAEQVNPGGFLLNLYMLAKTLHILKRNDEAIVHLENLVTLQETCVDDEQAKKDGIDLLNKLKR